MTSPQPRWHCQWCKQPSVVPSLNTQHEEMCEMRPSEETKP